MSTPRQPSGIEAAEADGRAQAEEMIAEWEPKKAERKEAWKQLYREQEEARRRLAERYGSDLENALTLKINDLLQPSLSSRAAALG